MHTLVLKVSVCHALHQVSNSIQCFLEYLLLHMQHEPNVKSKNTQLAQLQGTTVDITL